ncbi:MAG: translation initiation factor IF-2 [bacterium]|nr:translation initiation factor IF-2 [bacterium]
MNVTELARRVNLPPQELYELLPRYGFDIGRRAIKIDDRLAQQFIKQWPRIRRELQRQREKEREEELRKKRRESVLEGTAKSVVIPAIVSVRDFAALLQLPVSAVLQELLRNGILANLNEPIDYATAAIIAEDLGVQPHPAVDTSVEDAIAEAARPASVSSDVSAGAPEGVAMITRPPVVVVMGHVDHGKTAILDAIRQTNVAAGEAGGITQHIGAYQALFRDRHVTFIDTPGHEAFTTMRSRGARIADVAVLVVAGDDGVQPQTKEALKIIEAAKVPYVVAVNKMDKPDADAEKVKTALGALGVVPEDWGGKVPFVQLSAKERTGLDDLLEVVLLVADVDEARRRVVLEQAAETVTIESHVDKQEGPVATLLVQRGTLHVGDTLAVGNALAGKVRAMTAYNGEPLAAATPSTPARILGFKVLPEVGDIVRVAAVGEELIKTKRRKASSRATVMQAATPVSVGEEGSEPAVVLPVILRADVLGSLEAFASEIEKIGTAAARVRVVTKGLGNVTENDVKQAAAAGATIFGFGVRASDTIEQLARAANVAIVTHRIIYELLREVRVALEARLPEERIVEELGYIKILALFRASEHWQIVGGKVTSGKIVMDPNVQVMRDRDGAEGKLMALQAGKEEVREVVESQECGVKIKGIMDSEVGDVLKFIRVEIRKKKL